MMKSDRLPRDERRWVYTSADKANNYFGFGTDNDIESTPNYIIIKHSAFPLADTHSDPSWAIPSAKKMGAHRDRPKAFTPPSIVNISAMSYGSLGRTAVEALNRGSAIAGCLHNTGEGGVAPHHRHGGDLIWQLGTAYFGCRDKQGAFSMDKFMSVVESAPIRAIEVKLSQGAKPGLGGLLPAAKVTAEIAGIRGIPAGEDCRSPSKHSAFRDVDEMLDFVELLAANTGLPIGIKSAVGQLNFWVELAELMKSGERGVDFITVDGGEGGTGAGPLAFTDHVALPFKLGMTRVHQVFAERELDDKVVFIGSGRLGFPAPGLLALALGADMINVGREAMMAIGCIQAQECHTGHCPTGVATHKKWLMRGLDPKVKANKLANYIVTLRKELLQLAHACGFDDPAKVGLSEIEILDNRFQSESALKVFG